MIQTEYRSLGFCWTEYWSLGFCRMFICKHFSCLILHVLKTFVCILVETWTIPISEAFFPFHLLGLYIEGCSSFNFLCWNDINYIYDFRLLFYILTQVMSYKIMMFGFFFPLFRLLSRNSVPEIEYLLQVSTLSFVMTMSSLFWRVMVYGTACRASSSLILFMTS